MVTINVCSLLSHAFPMPTNNTFSLVSRAYLLGTCLGKSSSFGLHVPCVSFVTVYRFVC